MEEFRNRHNGPDEKQVKQMCKTIGVPDLDTLIEQTVPAKIGLGRKLDLPAALSEFKYLKHIREIARKNKPMRTFIGMGYYGTITPPVIQKNIFENPGWYTSYTPYQAEISQGRLEGMLNFQTMVADLTGFELSNASLLDEGSAAAEAMLMLFHARSRDAQKRGCNKFFVSQDVFPQTLDVIKSRAKYRDIELVTGSHETEVIDDSFFGALVQYPTWNGEINDYASFAEKVHEAGAHLVVAADLLSLALLKPPAAWGADVAVGSTQRFGIPLGYGGPHAAYFACKADFKRQIPGRIIGVSQDKHGHAALRLALQTREQHIRRDKATSNICTAQALLAVMAGMYAVYHGPEGIREIAEEIHRLTAGLDEAITSLGYNRVNNFFFDTVSYNLPDGISAGEFRQVAERKGINLNFHCGLVTLSMDETCTEQDIDEIASVFAEAGSKKPAVAGKVNSRIPEALARTSAYLQHPVFNSYHTENELMRYLKRLENKDISLTHSMISLGSCTMKMNAASEMAPVSMPEFANIHPFVPVGQVMGYRELIGEIGKYMCEITGFKAISFQPNSGAQGEFSGLMVIRAYHDQRKDIKRDVVLIPASAHGTNPASAVMAGMRVVVVKCDPNGNIDVADLSEKAKEAGDQLAALMVTYPSTHGVFEEAITEITDIVHNNGGLVYMDGANMNAQVGLTSPATIGADVCHLNLHKTFAIPHGGGGPGVGPIAVNEKLMPFLPGHPLTETGGKQGINAVSSAPYGSALILLISYGYIRMLGADGLTEATKKAILNANYLKARLEEAFPVLYKGSKDCVAHEMILDCRDFKRRAKIEVEDIAKRLIDYGFHAPTVSFPVHGTLMVEPTESESKSELDRFCDAMHSIREEITAVENGQYSPEDNPIVNAPHTATEIALDKWKHTYSRQSAVFPLPYLEENKYWPPVGKVDNAFGDRNLVCTCMRVADLETESVAH